MNFPYIGITGFTLEDQVKRLLDLIPENYHHKLMVGVLISDRTMEGISTRNRYANKHFIPTIFQNDKRVLNMLHFNTHNPSNLFCDLMKLVSIGGANLHGFQLNNRWPNPDEIHKFKTAYPDKKIVLEMGAPDFETFNPEQVAEKLLEYTDLGDYVILDMSAGAGIQMNPQKLIEYAICISQKTKFKIVFAGGLHSQNLKIIKPILQVFPDACIDAEGRLMSEWDVLDKDKTSAYLKKAMELFN